MAIFFQKIATMEDIIQVQELQFERDPTQGNREALIKLQEELGRYMVLEEAYWRQKSGLK